MVSCPMDYKIIIRRDAEAGVFFVEESDVVGLNAEASSWDDLVEIIHDLAPDLLRDNQQPTHGRLVLLEDRGALALA